MKVAVAMSQCCCRINVVIAKTRLEDGIRPPVTELQPQWKSVVVTQCVENIHNRHKLAAV